MWRWAAGYLLCCCVAVAEALPLVDYPDASVIKHTDQSGVDYRLTLGELKKADSRWRAEREQRLTGQLQRRTLEFAEDYDVAEIFSYYRNQLQQMGGRELFLCRSRRCGSSSAWANERFNVRQLYGLDNEQAYSAFEVVQSGELHSYVALYGVQRGNKRNYIQIDVLTTAQQVRISSSPDAIIERLEDGQAFSFVDVMGDGSLESDYLQSLVRVLQVKKSWAIAVLAHNYQPLALELQRSRSTAVAEGVRQQLVDAGVEEQRIQAYGIGGLVPGVRLGDRETLLQVVLIGG